MAADDGGTVVTVVHTGVPASGSADATALSCFWHVSLANLAAQCEGLPTMPPFDFSVPAQGDALVRTVIDVGVDEVFACLLDPSQLDKWANGDSSATPAQAGTSDRIEGGGKAVIEPVVGGRYEFGRPDNGPVQVLEVGAGQGTSPIPGDTQTARTPWCAGHCAVRGVRRT